MYQYYAVFYTYNGILQCPKTFYTEDRKEAITFAKEKKGYLVLTLKYDDFTVKED